ncbi:MAG: pyrroline-5-carboxylate reductase [Phycisphaerales bacterium]|jgi:pyrroline-5-carboxylate reductase|nr:pyrroline-5-carboxylate reductase [Phycisphaerales bacterium]
MDMGFLGVGHMGMAVLEGVLASGMVDAKAVLAVDHEARRRERASTLGCQVSADAADVRGLPMIVLCTRPQSFAEAAEELRSDGDRLLVSVMAGVESARIAAACGLGSRVVRAMPNAPAAVGKGMTAIAAGAGARAGDLDRAAELFSGVGRVVEVAESSMHAVTAVSGSGPAWFYLLAEAIREEGMALGLEASVAEALIRGTMEGAAAMMGGDSRSPAELRDAVTTPGGTTEAGLEAMRANGLVNAVRAGVQAACRRSEALSDG